MTGEAPLIVLDGVRKAFREGPRERVVFTELSASFGRGELTLLFGRSGTGKSTLLNLVSGIDLPDAGQVRVEGRSMADLSEPERTLYRRRHIGFVFQFFNLVPTLTVQENLLLPLELNGVRGPLARERVAEQLRRVGLADRASSYPDVLSGGEQQRVAIARALVHEPLLVLADEPTGNLDAQTGEEILALLTELVHGAGKTLLMVSHATEAIRYADRVLHLREGRVLEE